MIEGWPGWLLRNTPSFKNNHPVIHLWQKTSPINRLQPWLPIQSPARRKQEAQVEKFPCKQIPFKSTKSLQRAGKQVQVESKQISLYTKSPEKNFIQNSLLLKCPITKVTWHATNRLGPPALSACLAEEFHRSSCNRAPFQQNIKLIPSALNTRSI